MQLKGDYKVWTTANKEDAPTKILSGTTHGIEELHREYDKFIDVIMETGTVLDFACGVGRNTIELSNRLQSVHAYDFVTMITMLESTEVYKNKRNIFTYTDWSIIKEKKFDAIFCSLCLQNIHTEDLLTYLYDFTEMSDILYVFTRTYNDFNKDNIFKLLIKNWSIADAYGRSSSDIAGAEGEEHYLIKLVSNKSKGMVV